MKKMPTDVRVPVRKSRVRSTLGRAGRAGRWTLAAIVLGLALIGFLHLTRGTTVRATYGGVSSDGTPIAVGEPDFPLMVTMATSAWLVPGNRVEVRLNGDGLDRSSIRPSAGRWIRFFWTIFEMPKRSPSLPSSNRRGGHG